MCDKIWIKFRVSDNVLDEADWPVWTCLYDPATDKVVDSKEDHPGVYGVDNGPCAGWDLERINKWLAYDPTGSHPEVDHDVWVGGRWQFCKIFINIYGEVLSNEFGTQDAARLFGIPLDHVTPAMSAVVMDWHCILTHPMLHNIAQQVDVALREGVEQDLYSAIEEPGTLPRVGKLIKESIDKQIKAKMAEPVGPLFDPKKAVDSPLVLIYADIKRIEAVGEPEPDDLLVDGMSSLGGEYSPSELVWFVGGAVLAEIAKMSFFEVVGPNEDCLMGLLAGVKVYYNDAYADCDEAFLYYVTSGKVELLEYRILGPRKKADDPYSKFAEKATTKAHIAPIKAEATCIPYKIWKFRLVDELGYDAEHLRQWAVKEGMYLEAPPGEVVDKWADGILEERKITQMNGLSVHVGGEEIGKIESWYQSNKTYEKCVELKMPVGHGFGDHPRPCVPGKPNANGDVFPDPLLGSALDIYQNTPWIHTDKPGPGVDLDTEALSQIELEHNLMEKIAEQIREGLKGHIGDELDAAGIDRLKQQVVAIMGDWRAHELIRNIRVERDPTESGKYLVTYTVPNIDKLSGHFSEE